MFYPPPFSKTWKNETIKLIEIYTSQKTHFHQLRSKIPSTSVCGRESACVCVFQCFIRIIVIIMIVFIFSAVISFSSNIIVAVTYNI